MAARSARRAMGAERWRKGGEEEGVMWRAMEAGRIHRGWRRWGAGRRDRSGRLRLGLGFPEEIDLGNIGGELQKKTGKVSLEEQRHGMAAPDASGGSRSRGDQRRPEQRRRRRQAHARETGEKRSGEREDGVGSDLTQPNWALVDQSDIPIHFDQSFRPNQIKSTFYFLPFIQIN